MKLRPNLVHPLLAVLASTIPVLALPAPTRALPARQDRASIAEAHDLQRASEDPWGRGTPRDTVLGFLQAARERRWEDAERFLDLSRAAAGAPAESGQTLARHLEFLLDQGPPIDVDALSDDPVGDTTDGLAAGRERIGTISSARRDSAVLLELVPREEDGVPVWKFASSTVARVPALFAERGYGRVVDLLPRVLLDIRFLELALWQWIGLIVLALASWLLGWVLVRALVKGIMTFTARTRTRFDDRLLEASGPPVRLLAWIGCFRVGQPLLHLSVPADGMIRETSKVLVILAVAWLALRGIGIVSSIVKERLEAQGRSGASNLVPLGARGAKVAVLSITVLAALHTYGFDVTTILAGLGIGGLAVALAAQKTVENLFGGVSVLVDQPVRPGDFCRFGEKVGTVEDIGLRSTRIRTLDRTVISVPNADFSNLQIENFAPRDRIRLLATIGLRYETTPDQVRFVIAGLRRVLHGHPRIASDPRHVRLVGFGSSSLDLEVSAYVETSDPDEFAAVREDLFLQFMDVVTGSGTGFAFPSTTAYLARDGGLDAKRRKAAEAQVARWRSEGKLASPDFAAAEVDSMQGTLDWPPLGSATHG